MVTSRNPWYDTFAKFGAIQAIVVAILATSAYSALVATAPQEDPGKPSPFRGPWFVWCGLLVVALLIAIAKLATENKNFAVLSGMFSIFDALI